MKTQPDRLYGRQRGHKLRPRQQLLLDVTLPRLRLTDEQFANPRAAFSSPVEQVWLEIGFGGGEHAHALVKANPTVGLIASEVFENGLCSLLSHLVDEGAEETGPLPGNLRLWPVDARELLKELPAGSLDRAYLMFPDPWPKARHSKRRFVYPSNIEVMARLLKPGAEWRIASDHPVYQAWVEDVMGAQTLFERVSCAQERPADWYPTRYEAKAFREGRIPFYWIFRRRA